MRDGCSQSLAKQDLHVNKSKQMADSEKMKEMDFSHCAGKYFFFFFSNAKHLHEFKTFKNQKKKKEGYYLQREHLRLEECPE